MENEDQTFNALGFNFTYKYELQQSNETQQSSHG